MITCATVHTLDDTLEVLKHLGHENFDDKGSAELKQFFHLSLFGMMIVWMKYDLSLDQKKLHGSYQIVYQQYRVCWDCHFFPKELE